MSLSKPRRIVIKLGGGSLLPSAELARDIAHLVHSGDQVVVVHGGRAEIDTVARQLGHEPRHVRSVSGIESRLTDTPALDALMLGLLGRRNPSLVSALSNCGVSAVGLSGQDGCMVLARRRTALKVKIDGRSRIIRDDLSGTLIEVRPKLLTVLLDNGFVPVVCPPASGQDEGPLNIDSDTMAAAIAEALKADALIVLTDVPGVLRDLHDSETLIKVLDADQIPASVVGRMHHKVRATLRAAASVPHVVITDGRTAGCVDRGLRGVGTKLVASSGGDRVLAEEGA